MKQKQNIVRGFVTEDSPELTSPISEGETYYHHPTVTHRKSKKDYIGLLVRSIEIQAKAKTKLTALR